MKNRRILADAHGPIHGRVATEVPADKLVRFYFDDHNYVDVSFDGMRLQVRGNSALLVEASASNDFYASIKEPM